MSDEWRLYISGSGKPEKFYNYVPFYLTDKKQSQRGHSSAIQIPGRKAPIIHYGGTDAIKLRLNAKIKLGDDTLDDYERGFANLQWHMSKDWGGRQLDFSQLNSADENTISYEATQSTLETYGYAGPIYDMHKHQIYYDKGFTHVVYQYGGGSTSPDAYYIRQDHSASTWSGRTKIDDIPLTNDGHGCPSILVTNDGYLHCFYGCHGGTGDLLYKKSLSKRDGSSWSSVATISPASETPTYPRPINIDTDSTVLLFNRGSSSNQFNVMRKSTDSCASWGSIVNITQNPSNIWSYMAGLGVGNENPTKSVHIAWGQYSYSGGYNRNVYYAYSSDGGTTWRKTDDSTISLPMTTATAELISATDAGSYSRVMDCQVNNYNEPIVTFCLSPSSSGTGSIYFAKPISVDNWTMTTITTKSVAGPWAGGMLYVTDDGIILTIIIETINGVRQNKLFKSEDDGGTWEIATTLSDTTSEIMQGSQLIRFNDEGLVEYLYYTVQLSPGYTDPRTLSYGAVPYNRKMVNMIDYQIDEGSGRKDWYSARINLIRNKNW
jgi:hypothetical protein